MNTAQPSAALPPRARFEISDNKDNARRLALTTLASLIVGTLFLIGVGIIFKDNRGFFMAGVYAAMAVVTAFSLRLIKKDRLLLAVVMFNLAADVALIVSATFIANVGVAVALAVIILTILEAFSTLPPKTATRLVIASLVVAFLAFNINSIQVRWTTITRMDLPIAVYSAPLFAGFLVLMLAYLTYRKFVHITLQVKLLVAIMVATLVPLIILTYLSSTNTRSIVSNQVSDTLSVAASQTANVLDEMVDSTGKTVMSEAQLVVFHNFLGMPAENRAGSAEANTALETLQTLARKDRLNIISYALVDTSGQVVLDTNPISQGQLESGMSYFVDTVLSYVQTVSPVLFDARSNSPFIVFAAPVLTNEQKLLGLLRVKYNAEILMTALNRSMGMVQTGSFPILFDENFVRLADPVNTRDLYKTLVPLGSDRETFLQQTQRLPNRPSDQISNQYGLLYSELLPARNKVFTGNVLGEKVNYAGAVVTMRNMPWSVVYLQDTAVVLAPIERQSRIALNIASLIALLAAGGALVLSQILSKPIEVLTDTAQKVAEGDLLAQANVKTNDEIETLAVTFNSMTGQLRSLITGLEERVAQRTQELTEQARRMTYRATQLQTLADVARAIASVQDLEELLFSVTRLTSQRFNFYHVGIFLVDSNNEFAVLRAANSEGGARMLARNHRLKVGQIGMVGYVTSTGKPRIATDVGDDAVYFNNPDLPLTRSEMTLPFKQGERIIGALDVQSTAAGAFSEDDIALFVTLADQIAIAIVNNSLYSETRSALAEAKETHRRYLRQEWDQEITERRMHSFQYSARGVEETEMVATPEIQAAIESGEVHKAGSGEQAGALAVPIKLRGEVIGVIDLQQTAAGAWSDEEVALASSVADQIGVALENARLFEQTVRRAEREKKALEITNKIRSTNDPQVMLQTAITELQTALRASRAQIVMPEAPHAPGSNGNGHKKEPFTP